ncbi:hypothetical protein BAUCODRAFT_439100 [Baudoinia panamericana UAMH 10762]|uniref:Uncharacterized protein n=1 Tax=Baudoinia panamericana (strain UAMH 10762) TaxID=717646 RepID=M2ND44_BAUPA|nr:uncharacterized protein BAUCODRAFT_439100 [Baudoinia panamericana UAMH 10762]EMC97124.1 hypothetical protein BAUCODRAFT_439100 [Baudoinia panamericana UAMH 10762]
MPKKGGSGDMRRSLALIVRRTRELLGKGTLENSLAAVRRKLVYTARLTMSTLSLSADSHTVMRSDDAKVVDYGCVRSY